MTQGASVGGTGVKMDEKWRSDRARAANRARPKGGSDREENMNPLRTTARRVLTKFVANLPIIARRSVMEALVSGPNCYDLFQAIGRAHGVRDICVLGDYGAIEGSLADDGIMAGYAKHKSW